jgi:hypothetical protein
VEGRPDGGDSAGLPVAGIELTGPGPSERSLVYNTATQRSSAETIGYPVLSRH